MKMQRREFIQKTALGTGGLLLGTQLARPAQTGPEMFDAFETVQLGKTPLRFSRVMMGTGVRGGNRQSNHTRMGRENCEALMRGAFERGVRWFDLADMYGTHSYVVPALQGIPRSQFGIVSKIWFRSGGIPEKERPDADVVVERFLKEVGTDYLDVVQIHCVVSAKWPEEMRKQMDILAKLKERGLIRAHGVSCHSLDALVAAANEPWVDVVHARINPFGVKMDGPAEKVVPVLKQLKAAGKGVVGMKLIGEGEFRNDDEKRNQSVSFVLGLGCVDQLLVGFEKLEEIDDFAARVRKVPRLPAGAAIRG